MTNLSADALCLASNVMYCTIGVGGWDRIQILPHCKYIAVGHILYSNKIFVKIIARLSAKLLIFSWLSNGVMGG